MKSAERFHDVELSLIRQITALGVAFGQSGEGFLRISYAASIPDIEEGIRRMARFFDPLQ